MHRRGICYLVGAGPGDPGLITVKGLDCLHRAEIVYYDQLVSAQLLDEIPAQAERVDVGKRGGRYAFPQEELSARLCESVRQGKVVVRLKGGDPFIFGRGGEEAQALAAAGLPFEVVPGVTAGGAVAAYAGIPVTHRGVARAVTFITGHEAEENGQGPTDWNALARIDHTLCIYMGLKNLASICRQLIAGGRPPEEPVAVVEQGTLPRQRVLTGTLATIAERVRTEKPAPPVCVIVGREVELREDCAWFERRALGDKSS
jgi:uroporphyrinogen III methyltransferase/synthase